MLKNLLRPNDKLPIGMDIVRILSGAIIVSFGMEIMDPENIVGYTEWLTDIGLPFPNSMAYLGKLAELIFGLFLTVGLFTRISTIPLIITMCFINFIMLEGKIRSDTIYLALLFACFFFVGSGKISIDFLIGKSKAGKTDEKTG